MTPTEVLPPEPFTAELTRGNLKAAMEKSAHGSGEVWKVRRSEIKIRPGFNIRLDNLSHKADVRWLANSMKANGFIPTMPLTVSIAVENGETIIYCADGHTRLEAFDLAVSEGLQISDLLPCIAEARNISEVDRTFALHTANSGKPITPYGLGLLCQRLMHFGVDAPTISFRLGVTPKYVEDLLLLVTSPTLVRSMVINEKASAALAVEMIRKHGDKAGEILQASMQSLGGEVKTKVTKRDMPGYAFNSYVKKSGPKAFEVIQKLSMHESYSQLPDDLKTLVDSLLKDLPAQT